MASVKGGIDHGSDKQLLNDFLNSQHSSGLVVTNKAGSDSKILPESRNFSASKNTGAALNGIETKQNTNEFLSQQSQQNQIALGPNQQFSFPGTQLLNNTQASMGVNQGVILV